MKKKGTLRRKVRMGLSMAVLTAISCGVATPVMLPESVYAAEAETQEQALTRFGEVYGLLQDKHVSGVTDAQLTDAAIQGMIASLKDPYTVYYTKEQFAQFSNDLDLKYVGVGTRLSQDERGTFIVEVFDGSPAAEAGILSGDYIMEVNGQSTKGMSIDQIADAVRGTEGSEVTLTLQRTKELDKLVTVKMVRKEVTLSSVNSMVLSDGTGYMQVTAFTDLTDEAFASQLEQLQNKQISRLIVDLRNNPGGYLDSAQHMAEQFITEGTLIHTKDRNGIDEPVLLTGGKSVSVPVVFLVNENSASASEVLSGALQDYGRATVVGTLTYGKGSVQSIYKLSSGAAIKVTIEQYFTPKGKPVNHVGITPDVNVEGNVPQLIAALRTAGSPAIDVKLGTNSVQVNGLQLADPIVPLQLSGHLYVPARLLTSLVGGKISWNEQQQAVEISGNPAAGSMTYGADSGFVNQDGTGFIDISLFQKQFKELKWEKDADQVELHLQIESQKENR